MKTWRGVLLLAVAQLGCGGPGDPCTAPSACAADVAYTRAEIQTCQAAVRNASPDGGGMKCATEAKDYELCLRANRICGSDNKTDIGLTTAACATEINAYSTCLRR